MDGRELQKELDRIIAEKASNRGWTDKEIEIVRKLKDAGVPRRDIAIAVGKTTAQVDYLTTRCEYY